MPKTFFVADLHLPPQSNPQLQERFFSFLEFIQQEEGNLYILGDLFDYWANNSCLRLRNVVLFERLGELARGNRSIGLLIGNRDFLLKRKLVQQFGIEFLGETYSTRFDDQKVLLTHGDIFSTQELSFRLFRRYGWQLIRQLDLVTPGIVENYLGSKWVLRNNKRRAQKGGYKFTAEALQPYFGQGYDTIVCGHLHHGYIKSYPKNKKLVVLPCWQEDGGFCLLEKGIFHLLTNKEYAKGGEK